MLLLLLLLPPLQAKLRWLPEPALGGAFDGAPRPVFSWAGLRDNSFHGDLEKYLEDRIGYQRAAALLKKVSWEEQAKASGNLAQRLHDQAQQQYEREQMQQLSHPH